MTKAEQKKLALDHLRNKALEVERIGYEILINDVPCHMTDLGVRTAELRSMQQLLVDIEIITIDEGRLTIREGRESAQAE